ncbi:REVERSE TRANSCRIPTASE ZINC-BINDING DOMAIN-CONTAINING PROTEIN-RELATED-RELATED [Salix koriyanagi]|uniref:REVERSE TRANSCRIPTASE ZINC-BINDING DOMAIN-CONTAINING PROTEIN-RELATED-RELATED n=1 Tax=Salix koriyanagi TaxID=2511006 RepID=A0A9Q0U4B9_9ROSI|nr:REVERSE TRANSCRIPTASE ZINC-BINDING DOMAIN-CONTAINING PROTEIN-RELATED-RELATED [Salix koriyanagi]
MLVEKITARIKLWTSATLSYAGRLQLIKTTLFSMQVYWMSMFILPMAVIKRIESILARFLWRGPSLAANGSKVSWDRICYPLKEGGLGIKSSQEWNKAALLKHFWRILTCDHSIWSGWVHAVLLKGKSIWEVKAPSNASWTWRNLMGSRSWCKGLFQTKIGNGERTSLCFDYWVPGGYSLAETLPASTISSSTSTIRWDSKVSTIIRNGEWVFPNGHHVLQRVWNSITFLPNSHRQDTIKWRESPSGIFSIASAWNWLRRTRGNHNLHSLIWYSNHVPRYALTLWLASMGRLSTLDRPKMSFFNGGRHCVLCGIEDESHDHLFFHCSPVLGLSAPCEL